MTPWTAQEAQVIRGALQRIVSSPVFAQAERQRRFLQFIVEATLTGREESIKGYTIGIEVFDRPPDFDPSIDAIVRVEATRLRNKLREYYESANREEPVTITLPKGNYAPLICMDFPAKAALEGVNPVAADSPGPDTERVAIVVLPFVNLSSDAQQGYFADGLTEDLTTVLAHYEDLLVIARQSAFVYKNSSKTAKEIAVDLGVRYLVEGSVRSAGGRIRVTAQLIDALTGSHLWADKYDREMLDLFALQDEVTKQIAAVLLSKMDQRTSKVRNKSGNINLVAHDQILRGLQQFWLYTRESNHSAQAFFREAVRIDPRYALAHAWLARSLMFDYSVNWADSPQDVLIAALEHARLAVSLNDHLAFAHAVLCWAEVWNLRTNVAIEEGELAVAIDPNSADAHHFLSMAYAANAEPQSAMPHVETAMRLNPHPSAFYLFALGHCLLQLGRNEEAEAVLGQGVALREGFPPCHRFRAIALFRLGRRKEAEAEAGIVRRLASRSRSPNWYADKSKELPDFDHIMSTLGIDAS